jgi:hypothetical protein
MQIEQRRKLIEAMQIEQAKNQKKPVVNAKQANKPKKGAPVEEEEKAPVGI